MWEIGAPSRLVRAFSMPMFVPVVMVVVVCMVMAMVVVMVVVMVDMAVVVIVMPVVFADMLRRWWFARFLLRDRHRVGSHEMRVGHRCVRSRDIKRCGMKKA